MDDIYLINEARVVSVEQTILDLAGLGALATDSAKVMAAYYKKTDHEKAGMENECHE